MLIDLLTIFVNSLWFYMNCDIAELQFLPVAPLCYNTTCYQLLSELWWSSVSWKQRVKFYILKHGNTNEHNFYFEGKYSVSSLQQPFFSFFFSSFAEEQQIVINHLQHVSVFIGNYRQSLHSASHQNNHMNGWISCNHANYLQLDCIK